MLRAAPNWKPAAAMRRSAHARAQSRLVHKAIPPSSEPPGSGPTSWPDSHRGSRDSHCLSKAWPCARQRRTRKRSTAESPMESLSSKARGEIRDRQRFPEQDAAIATFAVQRVETIESANDKHDEDHDHRRDVVRHFDYRSLFGGIG